MLELDPTLITRLSRYLTSDLLDDLPQPATVSQSTQRLHSLYKTISSYLPHYIVEGEHFRADDYSNLTPGTFLFADVSGFTALSERLMEVAGAQGIETLTDIINDYFGTMLEILAKSDGELLKFAGDALLTFFPNKTDDQSDNEAVKAIHTGLRMQRSMRERFQPIQNRHLTGELQLHDLQLTMSIGIARGNLFEALVGGIGQRDHMIMGRLPGEAMDAEEEGDRDDVIITSEIQQTVSDQFETTPLGEGFHLVIDNFGDALGDYEFSMPQRRRAKSSFLFTFDDASLLDDLHKELVKVEDISRFVSSEIIKQLVVSGDHIDSANRLATVIFVHFTGFAELLEVWGEEYANRVSVLLSRYYGIMQRVIASNGGVLTRSDPYKLGSKLLITFGAPVAHPDDPDRAVATALEMHRQLRVFNNRVLEELPEFEDLFPFIRQRMGITQGDAFAGEVGWRQRREYTVMGDDVNLAARLMAKADFGEVIVSQDIWERVNPYYRTEPLEPFSVKGKSEPIHAHAILGAVRSSAVRTSDTPFIGREVNQHVLNLSLQEAAHGHRQLEAVALTGDIGVGKTRLAKQIAQAAVSSEFEVAWATCRSQSTRKTTWATLVGSLLGVNLADDLDSQIEHVSNRLDELELSELKDIFTDLLFDISDRGKPQSDQPAKSAAESHTRDELFAKLSSERTLAMNKDEMAQFRDRMKKALGNTGKSQLTFWDDLQAGTSLTESLLDFLKAYTREIKTLIVIDDLHKENPRALKILRRIMSELRGARLMILVAYEPTANIDLAAQHIAVPDLTEEETYLMTATLLGASELGPRLSHFIWESTSGRALYTESLIQALAEGGQLEEDQGIVELRPGADVDTLPNDVRGLVISRVDRLNSDAREVLRVASVFGENFNEAQVAFTSQIRGGNSVQHILDELSELQILEEEDDGDYSFKHGVMQQALYEELTRQQRQDIHQKIADYFLQQEDTDYNLLNHIYHLIKAGKANQAVKIVTESARQAEENNDVEQALELYSRALEILPDDERIQEEFERLQGLQNE